MKILKAVNHIKIVPRWIIFAIDIAIATFIFICTYALSNNFDFRLFRTQETALLYFFCISATTISFLVFKLYLVIVRYTSAFASIRILSTILFSLSIIFIVFGVTLPINTQFIVQYGLFLFLALIAYRTSINIFFQYSRTIKKTKKNVLVYGAGELGIAVKRTFDHDLTSNRIIVGYLDDYQAKIGKSIDGIKIYDPEDLLSILHKLDIDEVILATNQISAEKKSNLIDLCLEHNVHVLTLPPVSRIMSGGLNTNQIKKVKIEDLLERSQIRLKNGKVTEQIKGKRILVTGAA